MALPAPAGKTCSLIVLGLFFNTGYLCLTVFEQMVCRQHLGQQDVVVGPSLRPDLWVLLLATKWRTWRLQDATSALFMYNCSFVA